MVSVQVKYLEVYPTCIVLSTWNSMTFRAWVWGFDQGTGHSFILAGDRITNSTNKQRSWLYSLGPGFHISYINWVHYTGAVGRHLIDTVETILYVLRSSLLCAWTFFWGGGHRIILTKRDYAVFSDDHWQGTFCSSLWPHRIMDLSRIVELLTNSPAVVFHSSHIAKSTVAQRRWQKNRKGLRCKCSSGVFLHKAQKANRWALESSWYNRYTRRWKVLYISNSINILLSIGQLLTPWPGATIP